MKNIAALFFSLITAWLTPIVGLLVLIGSFIIFDTIMGVYASWRLKNPILSRKLQRAIVKSLLYSMSFLLVYGIDTLIVGEILKELTRVDIFLSKCYTVFLISVEVYSIDEKIRMVNKDKGFFFFLNKILSTLKSYREKISNITENRS